MAQPSSRTELKDYCLRKLGFPVIDINVDDDQLDDRIDDALQKYQEYHYDGTERTWLAHKLTAGDITNKYVQLADSIIGVSTVFPYTGSTQSSTSSAGFNIFDINYQLRLNDFYNLTSSSYTYYVIAREHLAMLDMIITGQYPFTFNKKTSRLNFQIQMTNRFTPGNFMCFECHRVVDTEIYSKVFNDMWLKEYTTQLFKRQWGENLKKYDNYVLPGGITINGQKIWDEASDEIEKLEFKLRDIYEEPTPFLVG
jgi:hypothetical protein